MTETAKATPAVACLGDAAELVRGVAYKPADLRSASDADGIPLLRATNIQNERLETTDVQYVAAPRVSPRQMMQQWDVLIAMSSGSKLAVGKLAQLVSPWSGTFGAFCGVLRPNPESVDPAYLGFVLRTTAFRERIELMAQGTNIKNLSKEHLLGFPMSLPPLEEQRRIAQILSTIERATDAARNVTLRQRAFTDSLDNSLFAPCIGGEWPLHRLGEVTVQRQYGLSVRGALAGALPILRMTNLSQGLVSYENLQFIEPESADVERYMLEPGDILFNRTNSPELVGRAGIVERAVPSVFASYLIRLVCDSSVVIPEFLNAYLNWEPTQVRLRGMATRGVSQANISASTLATLDVPTPPLNVQGSIVRAWRASRHCVDAALSETRALWGVFDAALSQLIGAVQ